MAETEVAEQDVVGKCCLTCSRGGAKMQCPCHNVFYCGTKCQGESWQEHKVYCTCYLRKQIEKRQQEVGRNAKELVVRWKEVGDIFLQQRRLVEAEECLSEAWRLDDMHAEDPSMRAGILESLATLYSKTLRLTGAVECAAKALHIYKGMAPEGGSVPHARMSVRMGQLMHVHGAHTHESQSLDACALITAGFQELSGLVEPEHPEVVRASLVVAKISHSCGENKENSAFLANHAVRIVRQAYPVDHPLAIFTMLKAGSIHAELGAWEKAERLLHKGLQLLRRHHPRDDNTHWKLLKNLSRCKCALGQLDEALKLRQQMVRIFRKLGHVKSDMGAHALRGVAAVLRKMGEPEAAEEKLDKAIDAAAAARNSPGLNGSVWYALALCRIQRGDLAGARTAAKTSVIEYDKVGLQCGTSERARGLLKKLEEG
eukprot:CAMPEP_0114116706 /NCGR_PEP_ID=MMETSP0043_2-20121206/4638_1 /TAXON_ID=464988 /ORGANISM="Hemiselmis andersenii, Strain CCMP644" /LENGTH=428 /DNA_ID=CAMNT_0001209039 /DNA_START=40 /DNA_END=1323 /DNA_ORIENTATION=+